MWVRIWLKKVEPLPRITLQKCETSEKEEEKKQVKTRKVKVEPLSRITLCAFTLELSLATKVTSENSLV